MDYKPRQSYKGSSYTYKKKRIFWFNSAFNDDFTLINGKIDDITFNVPPFQTYKNNNLKLLTFVREDANAKPIIIKLKEPYLTSRSVINTDKEAYPIIYANHTGCEGMTSKGNNFDLTPQQIPKFVFKFDENFTPILSAFGNNAIYQIFTYTGTIQTFNIPSGVSSVNIYCWGAGGGSSRAELNTTAIRGGNGGFVKATLTIPSGTTSLGIIVGQGGSKGRITGAETTRTAFGGGGSGVNNYIGWGLGGGGGLSGVFVNDANFTIVSSYYVNTNATAIIIAGGGGGAGGYSIETGDTHGGNGGSTTANDGSGNRAGGGGSQLAGGTAGTANGYAQGTAGSKYLGGNGTAGSFNAGGGGGYFGGGAGGVEAGKVSGAGGGSSFINTISYTITNITNLKNITNGTAIAVGNTETYYQTGIALGGLTATSSTTTNDGANGLVVIEYFVKRNDGITAGETLVQATNSSIAVVENSKYLINYQNPTNIPTGTYETFFSNGSILFRNKKFPRPWGAYFAEDWSGTTLLDSSGNGRHATTAGTITKTSGFGNGANGNINYLTGTTTSSITWPAGSIPSTFTILGLTRYNGASKQRIIQTNFGGHNWLQGHWTNNANMISYRGSAYFMAWMTDNAKTFGNLDDWLCSICKNSGTIPNNILMDGIGRGITTGGSGGYTMGINAGGGTTEYSDWALSVVLIWDTALSDAQMFELNRLIDDYKNTGRSIKNDLGLNFDYSYPILKDANGDTINPLVWYKFDVSTTSLVSDSSGNGRTLTASTSSPTFDNTSFIKGNGSALFVSANNQYFSMPRLNYNAINLVNGISFSFWCRLTNSTDNNGSIIEFSSYGVSNASILIMRNALTNNLKFYSEGGTTVDISTSGTNFFDGIWRHIVWTVSKTGFWTIYSNATSILTNAGKILPAFTSATNVDYIGSRSDGASNIDGNIDDFRIYDIELSATQVSELYNGRVSIYNPPNFEIGLEMNDVDLIVDNTISPYK